ncbi:MAG TPA: hypothetical protein VEF34_13050 [Syntrophobacteraceae bacterium]|nr:hypothetical protein [Syntrophobacteraceae bacterium]
MKPYPVTSPDPPEVSASGTPAQSPNEGQSFDMALEAAALEQRSLQTRAGSPTESLDEVFSRFPALSSAQFLQTPPSSGLDVAATHPKYAGQSSEPARMSGFQKYKDDQLLRNPGGRNYHLDEAKVVEDRTGQSPWGLIRKDFSDAFGNVRNFFGNMFLGTPVLYRDEKNEIRQGRQRGLLRTVSDFFKDLGSALSLGAYHPGSIEAPQGFKDRLLYAASKFKDAFFGDILTGVPSCVNHMGKNLILSGWHLVEVLPDAASGSFEPGRKLTTTIFDNGHVAVEYLTDIIPSGDAWLRVHASNLSELKLPVLYNLKMPEHYKGDLRWEYVRNTPFRKTVETIGSLLSDALAVALIGQTGSSSNRRNQSDY